MADGVDFNAVKQNAEAEGIPLGQIAILYRNLTEAEIARLNEFCLVVSINNDIVIAKFPEDGNAFFKDKATGVYLLGA